MKLVPHVYRYEQDALNAIPGGPWAYSITPGLRALFTALPSLSEIAPPRQGLATADNFRFLRYWWEVESSRIGFACLDSADARVTGKKWFPYMKGGGFQRWWGNQEYVVNWLNDGAEIKALGIETGRPASRAQNTAYYFRRGLTYSLISSGKFAARLSPGGFIFDVAGASAFPSDIALVLAVANSPTAEYLLRLINPTVNYQVGDLARLPIPTVNSDALQGRVEQAIALVQSMCEDDETTYDFIMPPSWRDGMGVVAARNAQLNEVERNVNEEVYGLYSINNDDRATVEEELHTALTLFAGDEGDATSIQELDMDNSLLESGGLTQTRLAECWVNYAVGIVLGRFAPGVEMALGRGRFVLKVAVALRALADEGGPVVCEGIHPDTLSVKVRRTLEIMCGEAEAQQVIDIATAGKSLVDYLKGDFYKAHVQQYRKRPVYWLLQSPKRNYSVYVFHERMTADTLHLLRGAEYLGGAINAAHNQQADLHSALLTAAPGRDRKKIEKQLDAVNALLTDLEAFDTNLAAVTGATNTRGEVVGWRPEIDDGVLLNLAPLHTLMPSWATEPRKAWEALARGDYDWARTARRYWPDRVEEACRHNKSFAIAHSLPTSEESR